MPRPTLIASISGIRGIFGSGLDPSVLVRYASAYGGWVRSQSQEDRPLVVVGRDARVTGALCAEIVRSTLCAVGCDVVDAGLATTPTVEMAVRIEGAAGGVILTASHNPAEWNALKLLNGEGEFLAPAEAEDVLARAEEDPATYCVGYDAIGSVRERDYLQEHIDAILDLPFIDADVIAAHGFRIVVDAINSVGAIALPALLDRLGIDRSRVTVLNAETTGRFAHEAEPLPDNLKGLMRRVEREGADVGFAVDPDVDRLALVADGGIYMSEELTQVVCADFLWRKREGAFATNLSSSRAIEDVAAKYGQKVYRSAVGEINVVKTMQQHNAILGGEGNGGVILPDLHYGRDALVGVAMVLQHLAELDTSLSQLRKELPTYHIAKKKTPLPEGVHPDDLLAALADAYADERLSTMDGVKIDFAEGWVHVRTSNTEPILRVYAEAGSPEAAGELADRFLTELQRLRHEA